MTLRSISLIKTDLHEDILEIRANNKRHFVNKKIPGVQDAVRRAIKREEIPNAKVRKRGNTLYLVLSDSAESSLPKRAGGPGRKRNGKQLQKKIVKAKLGA